MKKENLEYTLAITGIFSVLSIGLYISSCICTKGDTVCIRSCDIKNMFAMFTGIVAMLTGIIAIILFGIYGYKVIKTKRGKLK